MMTNNLGSAWAGIGIAAVCVAVIGCGRSDGMVTVTGTVTYNGVPVENGSISFTPVDGKSAAGGGTIEEGKIVRGQSSQGMIAVQIYATKEVVKKNPTAEEIERNILSDHVPYLPAPYNQQSKLRLTISDTERHFDFDLNDKGEIPVGMTGN
ncbi:hypothetical protein [Blastopirellula marina]|nr:hypothetical protein [Blastopirellula marina]